MLGAVVAKVFRADLVDRIQLWKENEGEATQLKVRIAELEQKLA